MAALGFARRIAQRKDGPPDRADRGSQLGGGERSCHPVERRDQGPSDHLKAAGKPAKVVIVACMRKLLSIMNAMLKTTPPWTVKTA